MNNLNRNTHTIHISSIGNRTVRFSSKDKISLLTYTHKDKLSLLKSNKHSHLKLTSIPTIQMISPALKEKIRININRHNSQRNNVITLHKEEVSFNYYQRIIHEKDKEIEELKNEIKYYKGKMNKSYMNVNEDKKIKIKIFNDYYNGSNDNICDYYLSTNSLRRINTVHNTKRNLQYELKGLYKRCKRVLNCCEEMFLSNRK